jgi:predicted small metal-binding protein
MEKRLSCADVSSDCKYVICAKTEQGIFERAREHARAEHNLNEIPRDLYEKMSSAIHDVERC